MSPLAPSDLFDLQYIRDGRYSPDGRYIAYATSCTESAEEHFELWISDSDGSRRRRVAFSGNATAPRWSADGCWIAFVGDARLRLVAFPSLAVWEPLTPEHLSVQGAPSWSPDSTHLAVCLLQRRAAEGPARITTRHFRAEGIGFTQALSQHVYVVNRSKGSLHCLTPAQGVCSQPEWSPCGKRILFLATDAAISYASYSPRLFTADTDSHDVTEVLGAGWYIACARWLPDGERIAVAAARDSTLTIATLSVWVVDRLGADAQLRTPGIIGSVGFWNHHDMPVWEFMYGSHALCILNGTTAFASAQKGGSVEVWRVSLEGDAAVDRVLTGERSCIVLDVSRAANSLLFASTNLHSPTELCRATLDSYQEERLTRLNEAVIAHWPPISVERFAFESSDGTEIETWFLAAADRQGPLPTVLFIHGGPFGSTGYAFRYDFLLLASQGYGIVFANFRGSAGYGEPFVRAIMGDWGARAYPDHIGAVDAAIARGFADPDRLGVWGPSYGGFATCWIVSHSTRFKAAIAEAAFTDFVTLYHLTDAPDVFAGDLGGRPHEIPDIYRARSPLTYAHRCTTPTMLVHGEDDLRCPISEAEQFYRVLQDVGCPTELLRIPECTHLGDSIGPLSARLAQNEALINWFQRHL